MPCGYYLEEAEEEGAALFDHPDFADTPGGSQRQRLRGRCHVVLLAARSTTRGRPGDHGLGGPPRGVPRAAARVDHAPEEVSEPLVPTRCSAEAVGRRRSVMTTTTGTHLGAFTPLDWALFLSIGLIWGSSFLLIAIGLDAFAPGLVTWLRIVFGAVGALAGTGRAPERCTDEDFPRLVAVSVLWVALPFTLFPLAEQHIASGVTGLINGALPIFAVAFGSIMLRRAPGRTQALGLAVGFLGIVAIALPSIQRGFERGDRRVDGAARRRLLRRRDQPRHAADAAVRVAPRDGPRDRARRASGPCRSGSRASRDSSFAWSSFLAVVVLGVMGTGVAFVLMGRLVARVGARASFATYLIPVVALILGVVFRDEVDPCAVGRRHRAGDRRAPCSRRGRSATHERRVPDPTTHPSWSSIPRRPR